MAGTCLQAASVARACATNQATQEFRALSGKMCWTAVIHCAHLAGVIDVNKHRSLTQPELHGELTYSRLVSENDPQVVDALSMRSVPEGHAVGFFQKDNNKIVMVHAMISLGNGRAAGNKNNCVGVGKAVGWEILDLADGLKWLETTGGIIAPGMLTAERNLYIHHRPVTDLQFN